MMYSGERPPVLLALAQPTDRLADLLTKLVPLLPPCFYAHLSAGLEHVFTAFYQAENHGLHHKMVLARPACLEVSNDYPVEQLTCADLDETLEFYNAAYPGHWFTARMLETGFYYGVRQGGRLVCVAGVHVFSPTFRAAALGNIAVLPEFRGRGLATAATAHLCHALLPVVDAVGLNVKADNAPAVACYRRLGFEWVADYTEFTFRLAQLP
ncbi:MAG TPA: GNAT family N-acetyltransferase, partial [Anaerolineales bacterium]|nr:GNAT family N-acetyltransferase [Anaerolineales bacterium]